MRHKDLYIKVAHVLAEYPRARDDDDFLVAIIYRNYYNVGQMPFFEVMTNLKEMELPTAESITRIRRRLQEELPIVYGASGGIRRERARERERYREEFGRK